MDFSPTGRDILSGLTHPVPLTVATKRRWTPIQLLEHLVATEQQERTRRSLERRLARARIGRFTPMSDFDWAWPTRIDRAAVEAVLRLDFLAAGRNLVLVASQGLGKTMIAQNIAQQPCSPGIASSSSRPPSYCSISAGRTPPAPWPAGFRSAGTASRRRGGASVLRRARAADLLFQVVSRHYEKRSLVLYDQLAL
jgi:IstB-like ATP binding protein